MIDIDVLNNPLLIGDLSCLAVGTWRDRVQIRRELLRGGLALARAILTNGASTTRATDPTYVREVQLVTWLEIGGILIILVNLSLGKRAIDRRRGITAILSLSKGLLLHLP